jgi:hypothetical protein
MSIMDKFVKVEGNKAVLTLFDGDDERAVRIPFKFEICPQCNGSGKSSAYLGAFTADEMNERDDEWREDYFAGRFDRQCETCVGHSGRIISPDYKKLSKRDHKLWCDQVKEERDYQRVSEMERKMGA